MPKYEYNLSGRIERNIVLCQANKLLSDGFVFNDRMKSWDKYESVFDKITYLDLDYLEEREVEVPTNRYLKSHKYTIEYRHKVKRTVPVNSYIQSHRIKIVYREYREQEEDLFEYEIEKDNEKSFNVTYIEHGESFLSGVFSFFKKVFNIKKVEREVTINRLRSLQEAQKKGKILELRYTVENDGKSEMKLTENEAEAMVKNRVGVKRLNDTSGNTKTVRKKVQDTEEIDAEMLPIFSRGKEIVSKEDILETVNLTAKEFMENGENLKLRSKGIASKEEFTEMEGMATIDASEYEKFMIGKEEISKTEEIETIDLTTKEYLKSMKPGSKNYELLEENVGTKKEIQSIAGSKTIKKEDYAEFMKGKTETGRKERVEEVLKEKILIDSREEVEYNYQYYQPGVWSRIGNHSEGNMANFVAQIRITYVSGFSPFDPDCLDKRELQEAVIGVIESEHYNGIYIRQRFDEQDGYRIERPKIS